jgi:hypothetical protein
MAFSHLAPAGLRSHGIRRGRILNVATIGVWSLGESSVNANGTHVCSRFASIEDANR